MKIFLRGEDQNAHIDTVQMPELPRLGDFVRTHEGERLVTRVTWIVAGDRVETWEVRLGPTPN
jgi:hypothetical protein